MSHVISLGISPCPNDTFIFDAWINGKLEKSVPRARCYLEDISTLNKMALKNRFDVVKVSFYAYGMLMDKYTLLNAGGAIGNKCGPLIVADSKKQYQQKKNMSIAVPGRWTTANLLLSMYRPEITNKVFMRFDRIMPAVQRGDVDAGVIIHEGRFTFEKYGLVMIKDLGAWWEEKTNSPIPLGAIIAKRSLGDDKLLLIESTIRESLKAAIANPESAFEFVKKHAGEMDIRAINQHIELYVNKYSLNYGTDGMKAISCLMEFAGEKGLLDDEGYRPGMCDTKTVLN